jgi:hypothetical protein
MAKTYGDPHQPLLPRLGRNDQGAFERSTPRHTINQTNSIRKIIENEEVRIKIEGEGSPFHQILITKTREAFFHIDNLTNSIHTDQTGAFPFTSQRGNRYIIVAIHLDANYIFVEPMRNRSKKEMIRAHEKIINRMRSAGLGIKKHMLDNEASDPFKQYIRRQEIQFELVPPGNHRRNQVERAIQTFKLHFIAILAGVDDKFPLSLWCLLLKPTELTLNLLRQSKVAPKISASVHIHGHHNYMKKPFGPLGCAIKAHVKPDDRRTWDTRSDAGFSLGTSMQHHRCFRMYITKTRATRISNTVYFKHQYITNPTVSPESHVVVAAQQLATALQGNIPAGNETAEALKKVSNLFTKIAAAKSKVAKAKAQCNRVQATPTARQTTHFPRMEIPLPRVANPSEAGSRVVPRVANRPQEDCRVVEDVPTLLTSRPVVQTPATHSKLRPPPLAVQPPAGCPNYISQDKDDNPPTMRHTTRSTATNSIMKEAMLSCVDIYKPKYVLSADLGILNFAATVPTGTTYTVSPQQMSVRRIPMTWFCEMANSVIGDNGDSWSITTS